MDTITIDINELNKIYSFNKEKTIEQFDKLVINCPYARIKLNCNDRLKCCSPECIKYAMYNYTLEDKHLCWHHALLYRK